MLLEALNSSGQYALSSGIINADLVALEQAGHGLGVQLCALPRMGSLLSVSVQRSQGRRPLGGTGAKRALSWC